MPRYVDADALIKKIFPYDVVDKKCYSINAKMIYEEIQKSPTADVVPKSDYIQQIAEVQGLREELIEAKAEIERLEAENKLLTENNVRNKYPNCVSVEKGRIYTRTLEDYDELIGDISAEAIKEFAERLKEKLYGFPTVYNSAFGRMIDNLIKEMTKCAAEPTKVSPHEICVVCGDQVPEGRQVCYMCENRQEFLTRKKE